MYCCLHLNYPHIHSLTPSTRTYRWWEKEGWTHQLIEVVLDPGQVGQGTDGHQTAQGKVKQLVAEEGDEPDITVLQKRTGEEGEWREILY